MSGLIDRAYGLWETALAEPRDLLVLRFTLLLLLLDATHAASFVVPLRILCGSMLVFGRLTRNRWLWTALAGTLGAHTLQGYWTIDNHQFLIAYWTLACALACWSRDADRVLCANARLLTALVFVFATAWKLLGGAYLDGSFFTHELLLDPRFAALAHLTTGIEQGALDYNREMARMLTTFPEGGIIVKIASAGAVTTVARALSYATILIEGSVAVAFLAALRKPGSEVADWLLIAFIVTTYTLTPVIGFGVVLTILGFAQCPVDRTQTRCGYLWTFVLVQFALLSQTDTLAQLLS